MKRGSWMTERWVFPALLVFVVLVLGIIVVAWQAARQQQRAEAEAALYADIPELRLTRYPSYNYTGAGGKHVVAYHISWQFLDPEGDTSRDYCVKKDLPMFQYLEPLVFDQDAKDRFDANPKEMAWSIIAGDERSLNAQSNRGHSGWYRTGNAIAPSVKVLVIRPKTKDARVVLLRPFNNTQRTTLEEVLLKTARAMGMERLEAGSWEDQGNNEFLYKFTLKKE
jgi:hypothetical protein